MHRINRRQILGVATAGAALAMGRAGAQTASGAASSPDASPFGPQWRRMTLGDATITVFSDGVNVTDGVQPTFAAEQPESAVSDLMTANFLPADKVALGFNILLVEIGDEKILFDTGLGEIGSAWGLGTMLNEMALAGHAPEDVTAVALTHMHADHIGGLMRAGQPVFPNARYFAGRAEYSYWTSPAAQSGPRPENVDLVAQYVTPLIDRMTLLEGGDNPLPGVVAKEAFGHSPGHLIYEVGSNDSGFAILGDVALHHALAFQRPDWGSGYDGDHQQAAETRRRVLGDLASRRMPLFAYHLPLPGIGYVRAEGDGFEFVPMTYQDRV